MEELSCMETMALYRVHKDLMTLRQQQNSAQLQHVLHGLELCTTCYSIISSTSPFILDLDLSVQIITVKLLLYAMSLDFTAWFNISVFNCTM